ncbi:MAG: hypothetical protein PHH26_09305 [Candidatus Thermoplasmatota archaeon]|nr:hypothetical protein [Candidatus Thermoplasmatota archaeon]
MIIIFSAVLVFSITGYVAYSGGEIQQSVESVRIEVQTDEAEYANGENITGNVFVVNDGETDIAITGYAYKVKSSQSDVEFGADFIFGSDFNLVVPANSRAALFAIEPDIIQKLGIVPGPCKMTFTVDLWGIENYDGVGEVTFTVIK